MPDLYNLPASDFNKITYLYDGSQSAGNATYNQSGLGSPVANLLLAGLAGGQNTISGQVVNSGSNNGLAGWSVYLSNSATSTAPLPGEATTTTDANGYFHFLVARRNLLCACRYRTRLEADQQRPIDCNHVQPRRR